MSNNQHEEAYWPDLLVQELRHLVRSSKFDFVKTSAILKTWWMSDAADVTARDRGQPLEMDKASIVIDADTCRTEFARDYSNAPYKRVPVVENTTAAPVVSSVEKIPTPTAVSENVKPSIMSLSNYDDDETYEQLMDRLEKQEQDNFRRKEEVFNKVARILGTMGMTDQDDTASANNKALMNEDGSLTAGQALAKSMGMAGALDRNVSRFKTPMDQEVHRAYEMGIAERRNKKLSRSALLAQRQEREALDAQREALRKRFDADSEDAQGDPFLFTSNDTATTHSKTASESDGKDVDTDVLANANAKVLELLRDVSEATPETAMSTVGTTHLTLPDAVVGADLSMGNFIDSPEFEDLLSSLEAEQALLAQEKDITNDAQQQEESDLASILRVLDEAARVSAESGGAKGADNSLTDFGLTVGKPKVMLKAGMGIANDPRAIKDENAKSENAAPALPPANANHVSPSKQSSRNTGASMGRHAVSVEVNDDDDDEDDDDDDDNVWRNRRKMLKEQAEQRPAPANGAVDTSVSISGYGGTASSNARSLKTKKPSDNKLQITIERASDRVSTAAEESKVSPTSPHQSSSALPQEGETLENSPASVSDNTWSDVMSPSPTKLKTEQFSLPSPPRNFEVEEEEDRVPVILPPKIEAAGVLLGAGDRSRKPKGKLLNVKKQVA